MKEKTERPNCVFCKTGCLKPGTATFTADRDGTVVVVRKVPALVCNQCGEESFEQAVSERLLQIAEEAVRKGTEVEICNYEAA